MFETKGSNKKSGNVDLLLDLIKIKINNLK